MKKHNFKRKKIPVYNIRRNERIEDEFDTDGEEYLNEPPAYTENGKIEYENE